MNDVVMAFKLLSGRNEVSSKGRKYECGDESNIMDVISLMKVKCSSAVG